MTLTLHEKGGVALTIGDFFKVKHGTSYTFCMLRKRNGEKEEGEKRRERRERMKNEGREEKRREKGGDINIIVHANSSNIC